MSFFAEASRMPRRKFRNNRTGSAAEQPRRNQFDWSVIVSHPRLSISTAGDDDEQNHTSLAWHWSTDIHPFLFFQLVIVSYPPSPPSPLATSSIARSAHVQPLHPSIFINIIIALEAPPLGHHTPPHGPRESRATLVTTGTIGAH